MICSINHSARFGESKFGNVFILTVRCDRYQPTIRKLDVMCLVPGTLSVICVSCLEHYQFTSNDVAVIALPEGYELCLLLICRVQMDNSTRSCENQGSDRPPAQGADAYVLHCLC